VVKDSQGRTEVYRREPVLAAGWALVGSPGLEQPLVRGPDGRGVRLGRPLLVPEPDEPEQAEDEHRQEQVRIDHRRILVARLRRGEARGKLVGRAERIAESVKQSNRHADELSTIASR
jgi:hypothetical protein